ncbi:MULTISPECIES: trehalose operon repressor [unclassified Pseudomonas]|uniref:trehalose operon repressor n=1 Tax=unclassified Pseudomonas TaxID=196821 RepID=UPI000BD7754D|nr:MULTISPECIES: trehalose operon repressor [unclassified Pseudomonas]PVZ15407.1 GntR family trehalose operon transcriptional repressor [Pseudomonas sp. URIL14HWK12:I12]PVZ24781.1 GntR family trehalose operon transcriptional repressor [Pseudomonas sp. URIL14HWK12:I10]PVZ34627.1 GntR family trehalose operon transcriptional repressor [Pseudomonas sp. URIL14HWK12:I11]SNZ08813.1 GntR family transcriptional regulator, trehalose operon transcriptional repressor [Pseudomonas sp. URIL14HWK12:I9]
MSKYNQIYSDLLASITTERLQPGARLPSETELMDSYQTSRGTVRRAIEQLQERGFAQKVHGKGTFVLSPAPIEFQLGGIVSFQETYPRLGNDVRTEVVEFGQVELQGSLLEHIQAEEGSLVTRIKRVRHIDGKREILDINHFVAELIPGLTPEIAEQSIYAFIEQTLQLQISYARRTIEAMPRGKDDQRHLDLDGQSHVIVVSNQTFLQDGRQFEYTESRHTLDKFYFSDVARR